MLCGQRLNWVAMTTFATPCTGRFPRLITAFFLVSRLSFAPKGFRTNYPGLILREAGRLVVKNAYPRAIGYYAAGSYPDFRLFHQSLLEIVSYLNGVHESYVAKALGLEKYQAWAAELPSHLQQGFVADRLAKRIEPLFDQ
jgi:hypothetical protein